MQHTPEVLRDALSFFQNDTGPLRRARVEHDGHVVTLPRWPGDSLCACVCRWFDQSLSAEGRREVSEVTTTRVLATSAISILQRQHLFTRGAHERPTHLKRVAEREKGGGRQGLCLERIRQGLSVSLPWPSTSASINPPCCRCGEQHAIEIECMVYICVARSPCTISATAPGAGSKT